LQRENGKDKAELSHANSTVEAQVKAYEELKNQLTLINERNHKMQMMNEVMRIKQLQQQEQMAYNMQTAAFQNQQENLSKMEEMLAAERAQRQDASSHTLEREE